jgi:hypothetical protein
MNNILAASCQGFVLQATIFGALLLLISEDSSIVEEVIP